MNKNNKTTIIVLAGVVVLLVIFFASRKTHFQRKVEEDWYYNIATVESVTLQEEKENVWNEPIYDYLWKVTYLYENKKYTGVLEEKNSNVSNRSSLENDYICIYINPEKPEEIATFSFHIDVEKD